MRLNCVIEDQPFITSVLDETEEQTEVRKAPAAGVVEVFVLTKAGTVCDDGANAMVERPAQQQGVAEPLILLRLDGLLLPAVTEQHQPQLLHLRIERVARRVGRVDAHRVGQPLDHAPAAPGPRLQFFDRARAVRMNGDNRLEQVRVASREVEDVFVGDEELRLLRIDGAVAPVMFVEGEQTVLAVMLDVADETHEPLGELRVGTLHVFDARGAEVDGELGAMERVTPRPHLRVDLVACAART
jgi:hypothetical protein